MSRSPTNRTALLSPWTTALLAGAMLGTFAAPPRAAAAFPQSPAPATPASSRQIGTVKSIAGGILTLTTDQGKQVEVTLAPTAKVLQLALTAGTALEVDTHRRVLVGRERIIEIGGQEELGVFGHPTHENAGRPALVPDRPVTRRSLSSPR